MHFLFCPGHMPIIPIRTMFPDFMPLFGGTHKNKKLEFDSVCVCARVQYMTYFKIILFSHYSIHIYWITKVHCTGSFQEIGLTIFNHLMPLYLQ